MWMDALLTAWSPSVCLGLTVEIREDDLFSPEPHFRALWIDKPALNNDGELLGSIWKVLCCPASCVSVADLGICGK